MRLENILQLTLLNWWNGDPRKSKEFLMAIANVMPVHIIKEMKNDFIRLYLFIMFESATF
jgi:hypothetical protein